MKKHTLATFLVSLIFSFALGFFVTTLIHPREKYRTHTRTYYHANGKVLREVNSLINIHEILAPEIQDGTDTRYDETGTIVEQGEWKDGKPAHPYRIARPTRNLFWFAGLWENDGFAILTRPAGGLVEFIHDREPVALPASRVDWWLTESIPGLCGENGIAAMGLSDVPLEAYPVTPQTTDPAFESPQCLEAVPVHKDPIQHAIDDPDLRWRDISESPRQPQYATLLIHDEKTVEGRWDGRAWRHPADTAPLKWCPPSKFVHRLNAG